MASKVVQCPKCEYQESVMSSRPGGEMPPCPRCEGFVQMVDISPGPGNRTTVISTAGVHPADESKPRAPLPQPKLQPKKRDPRDFGPEPRA